jgi:hypothetical protein
MSRDIDLEELLRTAAEAGATDIVLSPAPHVGKLIVRAASSPLLSRVVEPALLRSLSTQLGLRTGQPALLGGSDTVAASLASFEIEVGGATMRIRVICTPTPNGPVVRLRVQSRALLGQALEKFRDGAYGGLEVLERLGAPRGAIFVAGPTSGGKTSALHHLTALIERPVALVSEAHEFVAGDARIRTVDELEDGIDEVVAIDEVDETEKVPLAMSLARGRLVLATLGAPTLETALRRIRGASDDLDALIGVLRVDWRSGPSLRTPAYRWYPLSEQEAAAAPWIPRDLLTRMDDPAAFEALRRLESR